MFYFHRAEGLGCFLWRSHVLETLSSTTMTTNLDIEESLFTRYEMEEVLAEALRYR